MKHCSIPLRVHCSHPTTQLQAHKEIRQISDSPCTLLHLPVVLVVKDGQDQLLVLIQVLHSSNVEKLFMSI